MRQRCADFGSENRERDHPMIISRFLVQKKKREIIEWQHCSFRCVVLDIEEGRTWPSSPIFWKAGREKHMVGGIMFRVG